MGSDEQQTQSLAELARQALVGRVAREITHEINDLLVGVVGVAEASKEASTVRQLRQALQTSAEYGQKIATLIKTYQTLFSQPDPHRPAGPVDMGAVLDQALSLCRKRFALRQIEIQKNYESLPAVRADVGPMEQVFLELLHNALDTMADGSVLELTAKQTGEFVTVTGSEAGAETPAGNVGRTSGSSRSSEAKGGGGKQPGAPADVPANRFGLRLAESIVRRYGGESAAECAPGEYSRFTVRLPVYKEGSEP